MDVIECLSDIELTLLVVKRLHTCTSNNFIYKVSHKVCLILNSIYGKILYLAWHFVNTVYKCVYSYLFIHLLTETFLNFCFIFFR